MSDKAIKGLIVAPFLPEWCLCNLHTSNTPPLYRSPLIGIKGISHPGGSRDLFSVVFLIYW